MINTMEDFVREILSKGNIFLSVTQVLTHSALSIRTASWDTHSIDSSLSAPFSTFLIQLFLLFFSSFGGTVSRAVGGVLCDFLRDSEEAFSLALAAATGASAIAFAVAGAGLLLSPWRLGNMGLGLHLAAETGELFCCCAGTAVFEAILLLQSLFA